MQKSVRPDAGARPESGLERWLPVVLATLVHGAIAALLLWGVWHFRRPPPGPQPLAIEARLVMENAATRAPAAPAPEAPQTAPATLPQPTPAPQPPVPETPKPVPPPAPAPAPKPPQPNGALIAERQRQLALHEKTMRLQAEHDKAAREQATRQRAAEEARAAEARRQAEEAATRKVREAAQKAAEDKAQRESELRALLAGEERVNAARSSAEAAAYRSLIQARIQRAWIRPAGAQAGINCEVRVTQVPGGEVTGVQITRCNGDTALRESIEAAVYRASPLPIPSNPDLFDRNLVITFHPDD